MEISPRLQTAIVWAWELRRQKIRQRVKYKARFLHSLVNIDPYVHEDMMAATPSRYSQE